jgi:hypothetical protein
MIRWFIRHNKRFVMSKKKTKETMGETLPEAGGAEGCHVTCHGRDSQVCGDFYFMNVILWMCVTQQ